MTPFEMKDMKINANKIYYESKFNFLFQHNGFRPANIHLLIATSGGGKSTTVRTLTIDVLPKIPKGKKLLIWLSEETSDEFYIEINKTGIIDHGKELLNKLDIFSEQEHIDLNDKQLEVELKKLLDTGEYAFLILDNLTTSEMYMGKLPNEQGAFSKRLKAKIQEVKIPLILIAHTKADVTDNMPKLIESNDIRDSKSIINLAQFVYVLQTFYILEKRIQTLRITKARGYVIKQNMFILTFDEKTFMFSKDLAIPFDELKRIFKGRNKL